MRTKWFAAVVFALGFPLVIQLYTPQAQKTARTLTLLYSNNINGEVNPCPT